MGGGGGSSLKKRKIKKSNPYAVKCSGGCSTCMLLRSPSSHSMNIAVKNRLQNQHSALQEVYEKRDRIL